MAGSTGPDPRSDGPPREIPDIDLLPDTTADERDEGDRAQRGYDDEHYERERPPHHGS